MSISSIIPPSFHFGKILPNITTVDQANNLIISYTYALWFVRDMHNRLRFQKESINDPTHYRFYQDELLIIEKYIQDLEEKAQALSNIGL